MYIHYQWEPIKQSFAWYPQWRITMTNKNRRMFAKFVFNTSVWNGGTFKIKDGLWFHKIIQRGFFLPLKTWNLKNRSHNCEFGKFLHKWLAPYIIPTLWLDTISNNQKNTKIQTQIQKYKHKSKNANTNTKMQTQIHKSAFLVPGRRLYVYFGSQALWQVGL